MVYFLSMDGPQETTFSIRPTVEQAPFQQLVTRRIFLKWCNIHDSISPQYLSRTTWERERQEGMLREGVLLNHEFVKGGYKLFIPEDLKLWEMIDIIEEVDKHTFAHNPSAIRNRRKEFNDLGDRFINTGIYLAKHLTTIDEGKKTAIETAKDMYRYGNALRTGKYDEEVVIEDVQANTLTPRQTEEIDEWFGVDKLTTFKKQDREQARREMLRQFFKVTEQATVNKPHRKALKNVHRKYLTEPLTRPEQGLYDAMFVRGVERIVNEMGKHGWRDQVVTEFKKIGIDLEGQEKNLREALEIPRLKTELELVRQTGDVAKISQKEQWIAYVIQNAVSKIPYEVNTSSPAYIVETQMINCVAASMIGGKFLDEIGIRYLVGTLPNHSVTMLMTTDGKLYWHDFLVPQNNSELNDRNAQILIMHRRGREVKQPVNMAQVEKAVVSDYDVVVRQLDNICTFTSPEKGTQLQLLINASVVLMQMGQFTDAAEALQRALRLSENVWVTNNNLGVALKHTHDYRGAISAYKRAIAIDPTMSDAYKKLADLYVLLGNYEEANQVKRIGGIIHLRKTLGLPIMD